MTTTAKSRRIVRETPCFYRGRPIVIELGDRFITARLKGTRERYSLTYSEVFAHGAYISAAKTGRIPVLARRAC